MAIDTGMLPTTPALVRVRVGSVDTLALWRQPRLLNLASAADPRLHNLDALLVLPIVEARPLLDAAALDDLLELDPQELEWLAPVESQEVWACGVTYRRSREARMEEATAKDVYALVYEAERPEIFFKAAGWRVIPPDGAVGVRSDSTWDVPEPELSVLSNAHGEVFAYTCGNDMSSRSIEGENPLYLPQAKVYDRSCSLGPAAVLAWHAQTADARIDMVVERGGKEVFTGSASVRDLVRDLSDLVAVLHAVYTLPVGAWLMTGTCIVPPSYTAMPGDHVRISIENVGVLRNEIVRVEHSGAAAPPRLAEARHSREKSPVDD